jgi:DHA2 family multidrug resistance protein-like MFS transporter
MRPTHVLALGLTIAAGGLAAMAVAVDAHSLIGLVLANVVFSLGVSPCTAIIADLVVSAAPLERSGAASALSEVASEFGGAMGIALLGSLATLLYRSALGATMPKGLPASVVETAMRGIGDAASLRGKFPGAAELLSAVRSAYTGATQMTFFAAAGLMLLAAVGAIVMLGKGGQTEQSRTEPE